MSRPRPHPPEVITAAYFAITAALVLVAPAPLIQRWPVLLLHGVVIAVVLVGLPRLPEQGWPNVVRDVILVPAIVAIYAEVGVLNDLFGERFFDAEVMALERMLFQGDPSSTLRVLLPWWPLSEYLHFGYFGYYTLVVFGVVLYRERRYREYRYVLTVVLATFFFCYICFICFPVAGPWFLRPRPDPQQLGWIFPRVVHDVLGQGGILGLTFPSSHVAAAVAMWLLSWRFVRRLFWIFAGIVPALAVGTFYGGFHYAVDALAGVVVGASAYLGGPSLWRLAGGEPLGQGATEVSARPSQQAIIR